MSTFDTPEPITATIDLSVGDLRITAGDGGTTVVDVRPSDPSNDEDVKMAEQTRVEYAGGALLVKVPKLRQWRLRSDGGSIDVTIELPAGSNVHGTLAMVDVQVDGRLGDCRIKTGLGRIRLDETGTLDVKSGAGDISVERVTGDAEVTAGTGDIRLRELGGAAVIKNSNGDTWIGTAGGDLRVKAANGSIAVDVAQANVVGQVRQRRRPAGRRRARLGRARDRDRRPRGRHPRGHRRLPRRQRDRRQGAQRARRRRRARAVHRDRRGARPHLRRHDHDPAALT